jgi:Transposase DDE domain
LGSCWGLTRWAGYAISQRKRKCIEQVFGWSKTVGRIRQAMYRGRERVEQWFLLTQAAYNLTPPTPTLPRPTLK